MSHPHRFVFNASTNAFAGSVRAPFQETIEGQAATCLGVDGGLSTAKAHHFDYRGFFSFETAVSVVTGSFIEQDDSWETLITTRVEKLNILHVVTADAVISRLVSRQRRAEPDANGNVVGQEPEHLPLGSYFQNLRIAGCPIETVPGPLLTEELATFSKVYQLDPSEVILGSIFSSVSARCAGLSVQGNVVLVPGFGRVVLGELFLQRNERRLTMIRAELCSPVVAQVAVASSHGNGAPYPPYTK